MNLLFFDCETFLRTAIGRKIPEDNIKCFMYALSMCRYVESFYLFVCMKVWIAVSGKDGEIEWIIFKMSKSFQHIEYIIIFCAKFSNIIHLHSGHLVLCLMSGRLYWQTAGI